MPGDRGSSAAFSRFLFRCHHGSGRNPRCLVATIVSSVPGPGPVGLRLPTEALAFRPASGGAAMERVWGRRIYDNNVVVKARTPRLRRVSRTLLRWHRLAVARDLRYLSHQSNMTYRLPDSLWSPDNSNRRLSLPGTCALHTWRHLPPPDVRRTATPCNRTLPPLHADHGPMDTTALERPRAHRAPECIHISLPHAGSHLGRATPRVRASTCHLLAVRSSMLTPLPSFLPPPPRFAVETTLRIQSPVCTALLAVCMRTRW